MVTIEELRHFPIFADANEEDLSWLASKIEVESFQAGDVVREDGAPAHEMFFALEGSIEFHIRRGDRLRLWRKFGPGTVTGRLPYSRMETFPGRTIMTESGRVGSLDMSCFQEMLYRMPQTGQRLVEQLSDRIRRTTNTDKEQEKMMALGRLSAGLAHELNNPAASVTSAADALQSRLAALGEIVASVSALSLTEDQLQSIMSAPERCERPTNLTTLQLGEREDELLNWLEDQGFQDAWKLAPNFVECGVTVERIEELTTGFSQDAIHPIVRWMELQLVANNLVGDIKTASERISGLIGSVKSFSHMDRDPSKQEVNLIEGLESTLTMLGHKISKKDIQVVRNYATDLPLVSVFPGELNQVWTNIIDNAIDALPEEGELTISTEVAGNSVLVNIQDNGTGIPEELQPRVFEQFFTTKSVGEGTGLGLDISKRIVEGKHDGSLSFESKPGRTVFTVSLKFD